MPRTPKRRPAPARTVRIAGRTVKVRDQVSERTADRRGYCRPCSGNGAANGAICQDCGGTGAAKGTRRNP
jgi:DnaJ-class molecular chaperone